MKKQRPPAVVIHETPNMVMTARPRKQKLFGHTIVDTTIKLTGPGYREKIDKRKLPHPHGMGPGYCVAKLNFFGQLSMWDEFKAILKGCNYRELMSLARALDVTYGTVVNWREGRFDPSRSSTVLEVIVWARNGKPMDKMSQTWDGAKPMFHLDKVERLKALEESRLRVKLHPGPFDEVYSNPFDDDGEDDSQTWLNPWDRPPDFSSPFP